MENKEPEDFATQSEVVGTAGSRPMNLRQIEVFRTIMRTGSICGAGRVLHVSQPALSRVLALTESRLGYALFERARGRLVPTLEAQRLYGEVEAVYSGIDRVNDLAATLGREACGMLRVVAGATFAQWLIPQAVAHLDTASGKRARRDPRARVDYRSVTFDELIGYFQSGKADVALSMTAPKHPNITTRLLGQTKLVCVMPRGHDLARHDWIAARDLADTAWIGYPADAPLGRAMQQYLGAIPARPAAIQVHSSVTAIPFVVQGLGVALVDRWSIPPQLSALIDVRPIIDPPEIQIWASHSNLTALSLLGKRFIQSVQAVLDAQDRQADSA